MSLEELQKIADEQMKDPKVKAKMEALKNYLIHLIYIEPKLYEVLIALNISLKKKETKARKESGEEIFTVFTKLDHTTAKNLLDFQVSKKIGLAIKELIKNNPQRMFCKVEGAPFNVAYATLTLNNMTIDISRNSLRFKFCEVVLADEEDIGKVWNNDDVTDIMGYMFDNPRERYDLLYGIVKPLNDRIEKQLGIPKFLDLNIETVTITPIYIYTIFKK